MEGLPVDVRGSDSLDPLSAVDYPQLDHHRSLPGCHQETQTNDQPGRIDFISQRIVDESFSDDATFSFTFGRETSFNSNDRHAHRVHLLSDSGRISDPLLPAFIRRRLRLSNLLLDGSLSPAALLFRHPPVVLSVQSRHSQRALVYDDV